MKDYHTAKSNEGLSLPSSGVVLGHLAEALRLKTILRDDWEGASYKTVQRYFAGERVEPSTVDGIVEELLNSLIPADRETRLRDVVLSAVRMYMRNWDLFAAEVNQIGYPVFKVRDLPIAPLRLVVLDIGLRFGAWSSLEPTPSLTSILTGRGLGNLIDTLRDRIDLSVEALAMSLEVSTQAVSEWRAGRSLPTNDHIEAISKVLGEGAEGRQRIELAVRLQVGIQDVIRRLKTICGDSRIQDMLSAMERTTEIVAALAGDSLKLADSRGEGLRGQRLLWRVVVEGAQSPLGSMYSLGLAARCLGNPEVAADFAVLPGDWTGRWRYWMDHLGSTDRQAEFIGTLPFAKHLSPEMGSQVVEVAIEAQLRMAGFDEAHELPPGATMTVIPLPPTIAAMNFAGLAEQAASVGDLASAIKHYRKSIERDPTSAVIHFKLGATLGQFGRGEEGLVECHIAVQLDPEFGNARNEIGIILSNLRRHEEAEQAFAEAEPYSRDDAHHWFTRGNNFLALKDFEKARSSFEKCISLSKNQVHVDAMKHLSAVLMMLGKTDKARHLGRTVHHMTGANPVDHWMQIINIWDGSRK